jgi:CHAT domain-containing protein
MIFGAGWRCRPGVMVVVACASAFALQNQPESSALTEGVTVERTLSGGEAHLYRLTTGTREFARVTVEQRGIDVAVEVLDSAGNVVAEFDSEPRRNGQEVVTIAPDADGVSGLRVKARYAKDPAGAYQIRVSEIRASTEKERAVFSSHALATQAARLENDGKYDEALDRVTRAVGLAEGASEEDAAYFASLLTQRGALERRKGDYATAEQTFQRALDVSQKALGHDHLQTALALRGLAEVYIYLGNFPKAEPAADEQLQIIERTLGENHPRFAIGLGTSAFLHAYRNQFERAVAELQRAVAILEKTTGRDDYEFIAAFYNLGNILLLAGEQEHGVANMEQALGMIERKYGKDNFRVAAPLATLSAVALSEHQYARAIDFMWRAVAAREKILGSGHPDTAFLLYQIAVAYGDAGDYARAIEIQQRALGVLTETLGPYHRNTGFSLSALALAYALQGDVAHAVEYRRRAEDVTERNMALNLSVGSEREKLMIARSRGFESDLAISLNILQAPDDRIALETAALILLQRKGRVLDALSANVEALRMRLDAADRKALDDLQETNSALAKVALGGAGKTPAAEHRKQIASLEQQRDKLESQISLRSAEFRAQSQSVTLGAVQAAIPADAALVEFAVFRPYDIKQPPEKRSGEPHYVAYVLRQRGDIACRDLGPAKEIDQAVSAFREALSDAHNEAVQKWARTLDKRIAEPLRGALGEAKQLLLSPDGALNLIPFEALMDERGRYLVQRYSIHYLSAGRDLLRMQIPRTSKNGPMVIADPAFGEPAAQAAGKTPAIPTRSITTGVDLAKLYFAPLAGTADEARKIQSLFPVASVLTGLQASKASLRRAEAPSILHIATHGFFLDDSGKEAIENPLLRSGLALAGANSSTTNKDGILTALEASNLNLWGTKLVTLSACETGLGKVENWEGVYGLRRAFFLAGAETVVMSLWPVSDSVTREIMAGYYAYLKSGMGRGEALRRVQLAMLERKDRRHPFYWAGFIQSGDWRALDGK